MIRDLDVVPVWRAVIKSDAISGDCHIGRVVGRLVQGDVTMMWRIWLDNGRVVRVPPEAVTALPGDLDIPAVPAEAAWAATTTISPTPAVRAVNLERRARVFGATVREMIEAGFGSGIAP